MSQYMIATGHGVALLDLEVISPQPRDGAIRALRSYGDGGAQERAGHCFLQWNVLETPEQYQQLLDQFGLLDSLYSKVTLYTRNEVFDWTRFNGIAIQPQIAVDGQWARYFARDFVIVVRNLEALVEP
jgi:hypothetical protein